MKNLTYKISLMILGLFAAAFAADAQEIKGVVSDMNGEPLIGVSVAHRIPGNVMAVRQA